MDIYTHLTRQFNDNRLRAILGSGQAVVLHHLAIMSKDGDWLLRENRESMEWVLGVLDSYGARYRFGATLSLVEAHNVLVKHAQEVLPFGPSDAEAGNGYDQR